MHTPAEVEVKIGGKVHKGWSTYDIDSDLFVPADAWRVTLVQHTIELPPEVVEGAEVEVRLTREGKAETVLSGRLDDRTLQVGKGGQSLTLSGRDGAAVLLDCSSAIVAMQQLSLDDVIAKVVRPLGVKRIRIEADNKLTRERVNTEPGDSAWDTLRRAAEANGLWPWFEPDGTLVVGGPNYDKEPVASLVLAADGSGNNIEDLTETRSIASRFSEVTVLGQAHSWGEGGGERAGRNNVKAVVRDDGVPYYRPKILVDHEAVNEQIAKARGRKFISDSRLQGYTLQAVVMGHHTEGGQIWTPGQRVSLRSDPHGLDGTYFLTGRRLICRRQGGQQTLLTLKEDRVWVLDAHPSRRKHRRGKNSVPGRILDLSQGAA